MQLYGGVEAVIEGDSPVMSLLWDQHAQKEEWVFLLIDSCNAFNA